jgi:Tfp pilus assembly protein FimT
MAMVIGVILTAMAIPQVQSGIYRYRLQGAVASANWAIQSTRYQALMEGYPYQVVLTKSNTAYQIQNLPPGAGSYANVGNSVPLSGSAVTLGADTTLQFRPNGFVSAPVGALNFTITYKGLCQKVTVSNYANISLSTIAPTCP